MSIRILVGDCVDVMAAALEPESIDAVVTDPPYGIRFMGKAWDGADIDKRFQEANTDPKRRARTGAAAAAAAGKYDLAPARMRAFQEWTRLWAVQAFRVLKPGGHLISFASCRTYHRMACGVEEAGFEIRDQIGWLFGSGFPKSLDVAKAVDKIDAVRDRVGRALRFTEWMRSTGMTSARIDEITGTNMGGHYTTAASQPAVATREHMEMLRPFLPEIPAWVEDYVDQRVVASETYAKRPVIGEHEKQAAAAVWRERYAGSEAGAAKPITASFTPEAQRWEGWGTALKPAWEPVVLARKPLRGTVADNVLKFGTGAINIGGCRIEADDKTPAPVGEYAGSAIGPTGHTGVRDGSADAVGRWPANVIHDGSAEVLEHFPDDNGPAPGLKTGSMSARVARAVSAAIEFNPLDNGSAARFFYTAKASRHDRNDGLQGLPERVTDDGRDTPADNAYQRGKTMRANHHPTVKPTDLMRYLCRLITPPGGTVLDPFCGSGSTLKAAELEGFSAVGIELDPEYVEIARRRIAADAPLFQEVEVHQHEPSASLNPGGPPPQHEDRPPVG